MFITGTRAIANAYAKINLTLDVLGKRSDGYHNVKMIMQSISLFDLLIIDKTPGGISVSTNLKFLPAGEKNIAYKAAATFFDHTKINGGASIIIHKNIPVGAGLAGGSTDAAAVLKALNALYEAGLGTDELQKIGLMIGADVPYCLEGKTMLAEGTGEKLTLLPSLAGINILIVKPPVSVSTASVYADIDSVGIDVHPDTDRIISAIGNGKFSSVTHDLCNVMENVTVKKHPEIAEIKRKLLSDGAAAALMSGSGPSVFGIFADFADAEKSFRDFSELYREVFLTAAV